ncbi:MAG: hypothetical protein DHS20C17_06820 [Cyclobacteriaceae bacterium]|nr:MAG: hypothetical protein DHS20C17_06820 [Cyclobacteriaceae bacterium]
MVKWSCLLLISTLIGTSCRENEPETLFSLLPSKETNIDFQNLVKETEVFNVLEYGYFYNGGGVAIGDINNDGLPDIYFTGNMVASHLYLNKGNWEFEEIAERAGVAASGLWNTGTTMADVNGDGYLDIYVCRSAAASAANRKNLLFINNRDLTFSEQAASKGLADPGYSTQAAFFDYDQDGDLDMYLLNHSVQEYAGFSNLTHTLKTRNNRDHGDKLFRNDGSQFTNVTQTAGIKTNVLGFGLGIGISDVNDDGWPDVYVSNDYNEEDYLYINQQDGTFTDQLKDYMAHVSLFSMGSDIADFNNDGYPDIMTLDMLPEDNYRQKLVSGPDNYDKYQRLITSGFYHQSMRNMLQLNHQGLGFSEIGQFAGVSNTDWSWSSLFADFDNDGFKDLFITNGYQRDYTNMDFMNFLVSETLREQAGGEALATMETIEQMPSILVPNYIYQNQGDLTFEKKTEAWGMNQPSLSNGAAYADLDNDGDLDLVVNNVNEQAFIYRNNARELNQNNYITIKLVGNDLNTRGVGSKVTVHCNDDQYVQELMPTRGYQSAVDHTLVFGLGSCQLVDSITVIWPNGMQQLISGQPVNQSITIDQSQAVDKPLNTKEPASPKLLSEIPVNIYKHIENPYIDFKKQQLLPHKLSTMGPRIAVTDLNGDKLDDLYIGGSKGYSGQVLQQLPSGEFNIYLETDPEFEDVGSLFFDADQDGDMDLYIVSGGEDFLAGDSLLQDRLYRNQGQGNLVRDHLALPEMRVSGSSVSAADYDQDGDLDLFVGGRLIPGAYPESPRSYLLQNDGQGKFTDVTEQVNAQLMHPGLVTDVLWSDYNGDQWEDLILVGEWMPVRIFQNNQGNLDEVSSSAGTDLLSGWWNRVQEYDLDQDGDADYLLGNFGWNSQITASQQRPVTLHTKDFDGNGQLDPILCYYVGEKSYPAFSKDDLEKQLPLIKKKYLKYADYADQTITDIFTPEELEGVHVLEARELSSGYLRNLGEGKFRFEAFPAVSQLAPVYAIMVDHLDADDIPDIVLAGNFMGSRVKFGSYDASMGTVLKGVGNGSFQVLSPSISGLMVKGEVRDIAMINTASNSRWVLFGRNNETVSVFKVNK